MQAVVSTRDLAEELGVIPDTVARWVRDGRFPGAFRVGGRWRIPMEEAEIFAEEYEGAPDGTFAGAFAEEEDEDFPQNWDDDEDE